MPADVLVVSAPLDQIVQRRQPVGLLRCLGQHVHHLRRVALDANLNGSIGQRHCIGHPNQHHEPAGRVRNDDVQVADTGINKAYVDRVRTSWPSTCCEWSGSIVAERVTLATYCTLNRAADSPSFLPWESATHSL